RQAKSRGCSCDRLSLLPRLIPVYALSLKELRKLGAEWVQLDEPVLAMDMDAREREAMAGAYAALAEAAPGLSLMVCAYFGTYGGNLPCALELPVQALHLDAFRAESELDAVLAGLAAGKILSLGIVDGRNVWKNDFSRSLDLISKARERIGADRLILAPSCSLLHVPLSLADEKPTPEYLLPWLSFAEEKLRELATLARLAQAGNGRATGEFAANQAALESRRSHPEIRSPQVRAGTSRIDADLETRRSPYGVRKGLQRDRLRLPLFPTTTIGSFPQTGEVRRARSQWKKGLLDDAAYYAFLEAATVDAVRKQEEIGLDVLVHGEFERNDMVEFFGERLAGFGFTSGGWVQSYGTRCVKPPIIYGDVRRMRPMTLDWAVFAMKAKQKPMKGMLTGPVTILKWSFPRDDQPPADTAVQIALAIRDETLDLESAGIPIVQIDEPAFREALPLRRSEWGACLDWE